MRIKKNYQLNMSMPQPECGKMINGQALGEVANLKYGLFTMSLNGCEVIAVCNALCYLGKPQPIVEIARFMERYSVLLGLCGCNVYRVGRGLAKFGAEFEKVREIGDARAFVISYWTGRPLMSSIHTVFCTQENGEITVYNRSNGCGTPRIYKSAEEAFGKRKPMIVYRLEEQNESQN